MENITQEIIVAPKSEAAIQSDTASVMSIIAKVAADPNVDPEKLSKLLDMQERIMAKEAEIAFNKALARIAKKMPRVIKGGSVGYKEDKNNKNSAVVEAFKFARYEDIDKAVRPLLVAEGFSLSFDTVMREGGGVILTGTLSHKEGHSRSASIPLALDNSGGKNNIQGMGSTTSYGRRYTMCMLLNIVTVGEDDDGAAANDYLSNVEAVEIDLLIKDAGANKTKFLEFMKAESVQTILAKDYLKAKNMLMQKKQQSTKKDAHANS